MVGIGRPLSASASRHPRRRSRRSRARVPLLGVPWRAVEAVDERGEQRRDEETLARLINSCRQSADDTGQQATEVAPGAGEPLSCESEHGIQATRHNGPSRGIRKCAYLQWEKSGGSFWRSGGAIVAGCACGVYVVVCAAVPSLLGAFVFGSVISHQQRRMNKRFQFRSME